MSVVSHIQLLLLLYIFYKVPNVHTQPKDDRFNKNYKYFADQDGRMYSRYYRDSYTEFEHALDDDRCEGRSQAPVEVVRETMFGIVRGRQISLCDSPGVALRHRPGQPTAFGPKNIVRVFLGIPYAEPPIRRRDGFSYQLKVIFKNFFTR